jgi:hypothetical protein
VTVVSYTSAGSGQWLCPAGVTFAEVQVWGGGGGGGAGGSATGGGGGGGYSSEATVAVTPGTLYAWTVGIGGASGSNGGRSFFIGDALTIAANGGKGATTSAGAAGGTGSTNTTNYGGGSGGSGSTGGGGGGSSAGTGSAGNNGSNGSSSVGGSGGPAPAGGAAGGTGGFRGGGFPGSAPGAGGGGAGTSGPGAGGTGGAGQIQVTYTAPVQPQIPFFPAGHAPIPDDFNEWFYNPNTFLNSKIVFRAALTSATAMSSGADTVLPFNVILEDPYGGWESGASQWLAPQDGLYSVALTVSCQPAAAEPVVAARIGIDSSTYEYEVDRAWVPGATVPGIASGALPVYMYLGDSVQGIGHMFGAAGTTVATAGQQAQMSICWHAT